MEKECIMGTTNMELVASWVFFQKCTASNWQTCWPPSNPNHPLLKSFWIIQDVQKQHGKGEVNDPLYGNMFAGVSGKPTNTLNVQRGAMKVALEFAQACTTNNALYGNLDEWFVALAKFVLIPEVLEDDKEKQRAIVEHRDRIT